MYIKNNTLQKLIQDFRNAGLNDAEIKYMLKNYADYATPSLDIEKRYQYLFAKGESDGYSRDEIIKITIEHPKTLGANKYPRSSFARWRENCQNCPKVLTDANLDIDHEKIEEILTNMHLRKQEIDTIFNNNNELIYETPARILERLEFWENSGLNKYQIAYYIYCGSNFMEISLAEIEEIKQILSSYQLKPYLISYIIINMLNSRPNYIFNLAKIKDMLQYVISLNIPDLENALRQNYDFFFASLEKVQSNYEALNCFTSDELKTILSANLSLLSQSLNKIIMVEEMLIKNSFTRNVLVRFFANRDVNNVICADVDGLERKIKLYIKMRIIGYVVASPMNLKQSADLTIARYNYIRHFYPSELKKMGYPSILFCGEHVFQKNFNVSSAYLLSYNAQVKQKKLGY